MEETLILIKPDGMEKKLIGEIISRLEKSGLDIVHSKILVPSEDMLEKHYTLTDEWVSSLASKTR
ncbi:MAG: nucleoside-diphosphate kinase, partial [DPANN group archaeon]|nr:nucleoside-diphosphate kinase [DPANN group archaeon]